MVTWSKTNPEIQSKQQSGLPIPISDVSAIKDENQFLEAISEISPEWQQWLINKFIDQSNDNPPPIGSSLVFSPLNDEELTRALTFDLPTWRLFLHPIQKLAVDDLDHMSIGVVGGTGTGKTVVLLNRLISNSPSGEDEDCSVLLTYSQNLAEHLRTIVKRLAKNQHFYVFPLYYLGVICQLNQ